VALSQRGASVIFQRDLPEHIPGAANFAKQESEFQKIKDSIQLKDVDTVVGTLKMADLHKYRILTGDLAPLLKFCGVPRESMVDSGLHFIRRSFDDGWNYFIVNNTGTNFDGWITLTKLATKSVICLDPLAGEAGIPAQQEVLVDESGKTYAGHWYPEKVRVQLASGESVVLRALADKKVEGKDWKHWQTNGEPAEVSGTWNVKFLSGGPTLLADTQITKLASWTTFADTNAQAFGGTAKYSISFDAPRAGSANYLLNLGDVRQSARVKLNGKDYGVLITSPFQIAVDNLKPTGNQLEVEVTSVDANRIRDLDRRGVKWKTFRDINVVNVDYQPFSAANWPLTECGLLGPVTLTPIGAN
jgi:hypothetical protein